MSNEISLNFSLTCFKPAIMESALGRAFTSQLISMAGNFISYGSLLIGTSATAFPLGQITSLGWCWFNNLDPANYFTVRNGSGGTDVLAFQAGWADWVPMLPACVPYGVAHTSPVQVEFLLLSL